MRDRYAIFTHTLLLAAAVLLLSTPLSTTVLAVSGHPGLTVDEMIELKALGFSETDIQAEINRTETGYEISEGELKKLKEAGFSDYFRSFVRSLRPKKRLTNQAIAEMVQRQVSAEQILKEILDSERAFDPSPQELLRISRKFRIPRAVIRAMRGHPLTMEEMKSLAEQGVPTSQLSLLLDIVGFEAVDFGPSQALELVRAGIPAEMVARLRTAGKSETTEGGNPPKPGLYPHPLGLFELNYPKNWQMIREIKDGNVLYAVTPEIEKSKLDDVIIGFEVMLSGIDENALISDMKPEQALERLLPLFLQNEQGMRPVGTVVQAKMGGLSCGRQTLEGTLKGKQGEFRADLYLGFKERLLCMAVAVAPSERFSQFSGYFEDILDKSSFLPDRAPVVRQRQQNANEVAAKSKGSVVSITSYRGDQALGTGSGFVVREDGYIITNHHVIWDSEKDRPANRFTVEWDDDLKIPIKEAKLIAYKRTESPILLINWGVDIALLKIPDDRKYEKVSLTPLSQVRLGDPVLTMGFPARGTIPTLSTIITSGIVTRFNKDFRGKVESIYTDAPTAHGSSGGPCLSLVTGGVIGLNTYGVDVKLAQQIPGSENLVNYHGVVPIDCALKEFPLATQVSVSREKALDFIDYFDLALRSADLGASSSSIRMAERAVEKSDHSAAAYSLLGMLQVASATGRAGLETGFKTLERALSINPKHLDTLLFLAEAKMQTDEPLEAIRYADRAVEAEPGDWRPYESRAKMNLFAKRYDEALKDLDRAKTLSRHVLPNPYMLAGDAYYAMGRLEDGKEEYLKAVKIHPSNLQARMGVARYYMLTKHYISALLEYDRLNRERPGTPSVLAAMGACYRKIKKFEKALKHYDDSIVRWRQLNMTPPEEAFLEAGDIASKDLNQPKVAILFYSQYLLPYFEAEKAFDVHMSLAKILEDNNISKGIAKGHIIRALLMRQNDTEVQKKLKGLNVNMSKADIGLMLKLRYDPLLAAKIIAVTPLDFQVRTKEDIGALLNEFPEVVVVGILESQKTYEEIRKKQGDGQGAQEQGGGGQGQGSAGVPQGLVGTWIGQINNPYGGMRLGQIELVLQGSGRFQSQTIMAGMTERDTGTFELTATTLVLNSDTGKKHTFIVRFVGNQFMVSIPQFGEVALTRTR